MKSLDIPCGVCGAHAHEPCRTRSNVLTEKPHAVRVAAAKRGNRPPHTHA